MLIKNWTYERKIKQLEFACENYLDMVSVNRAVANDESDYSTLYENVREFFAVIAEDLRRLESLEK